MIKTFEQVISNKHAVKINHALELKNNLNILNEFYGLNLSAEELIPIAPIFDYVDHPLNLVIKPSTKLTRSNLPARHVAGSIRSKASVKKLKRCQLPKWRIEGERIHRSHLGSSIKAYRFDEPQTSKERSFLDLVVVIDRLLLLEMVYPSQRFLKYFDAKRYLELSLGNLSQNTAMSAGHPTDNRLHYLQWKTFLSDYCEYSTFVKTQVCGDVCFAITHMLTEFAHETSFDAVLVKMRNNLRCSVWREYWGAKDLTWTKRVIDVEGNEQTVFIHEHELANFKAYPKDNINIPPRTFFHEGYLAALEEKVGFLTNPVEFTTFTKEQLNRHQHQVIPIGNSLQLINEGRLMKHCIGGETYLERGKSGENIYFRFIPRREDPQDYTNHFTVTLELCPDSAPHADPDMERDDVVEDNRPHFRNLGARNIEGLSNYQLLEVWGYDNVVPDFYTMREIYSFLCSNTELFQALAKQTSQKIHEKT